jgi:hypothetical protein
MPLTCASVLLPRGLQDENRVNATAMGRSVIAGVMPCDPVLRASRELHRYGPNHEPQTGR